MTKPFFKYLRNLSIVAIALYLTICILLYAFQDKLLFHPQPKDKSEIAELLKRSPAFDTLFLTMKDGTRIGAYMNKDTGSAPMPLILYFGGNAEEVSHMMLKKPYFKNCHLVLVNYIGFGLCGGQPSEKTMFSDALEIYDHLQKQSYTDPGNILVIGRSIGTGVATYLSSQRNIKASILITPYESMIAVAGEKYKFIPMSLLLQHPFESDKYALAITSPMHALIAKNDAVIPRHHAYTLLKKWKGKTTFLEIDADHNSIMDKDTVWKSIEAFIMLNSK